MKHHPFQIARLALAAGFGVMLLAVTLPKSNPSPAWQLAEQARYGWRLPKPSRSLPGEQQSESKFAKREDRGSESAKMREGVSQREPFRTAHLPGRIEHGDRADRIRIQAPIFFEDEESIPSNLAPDPVHLEPPEVPFRPGR